MIYRTNAKRKSPRVSATSLPKGTVRKGVDQNLWEIRVASNGVPRWVRLNSVTGRRPKTTRLKTTGSSKSRTKMITRTFAGRKAPRASATQFRFGIAKRGVDGRIWVVISASNGVKRWVPKSSQTKKAKKPAKKATKHTKKHSKKAAATKKAAGKSGRVKTKGGNSKKDLSVVIEVSIDRYPVWIDEVVKAVDAAFGKSPHAFDGIGAVAGGTRLSAYDLFWLAKDTSRIPAIKKVLKTFLGSDFNVYVHK
jgi:hypothetical protein